VDNVTEKSRSSYVKLLRLFALSYDTLVFSGRQSCMAASGKVSPISYVCYDCIDGNKVLVLY